MNGSGNNAASTSTSPQIPAPDVDIHVDECVPLLSGLGSQDGIARKKVKKPFYRARPLWLVPFALVASLTRGMTLAPRVEVFTQLSCHRVYGLHPGHFTLPAAFPQTATNTSSIGFSIFERPNRISALTFPSHAPGSPPFVQLSIVDGGDIFDSGGDDEDTVDPNDSTSDPRNVPSRRCVEDPDVQAGAARLQMIMTTTMGLLSALTTGWWGHFGERFGRTRVLAISTCGLFLTDLVFILVSTPTSPLSKHGHKLLLIAPVIEGALGGWSTLQASTSAYISDCTSSGSRAHIFSRFTGVTYLGIFFGPSISGYLISRSSANGSGGVGGTRNVTSVFWVAVFCSFVNFLASVFVFPESLSKESREKAREEYNGIGKGKARAQGGVPGSREGRGGVGFVRGLFGPLSVFLPVKVRESRLGKYRRDWSLTVLAVSFFCFMLCVGLYQLKYLYAEHTYGWGAEQLSWYISFLGGMRAISLLLVLPYIIGIFKPKVVDPMPATKGKGKAKSKVSAALSSGEGATPEDGAKRKPTRSQLGREIAFDLTLTRCSFLMDTIANLLIIASPAPVFHHASAGLGVMDRRDRQAIRGASLMQSQALFVLASGMASFGTGAAPAIHSLTLCILQAREMCHEDGDPETAGGVSAETDTARSGNGNVGGLFGAFAFLQSIGSMILGPMMFGMIYSSTVANVPKAIFMVAAATVCVALVLMMLVQNPVHAGVTVKKKMKKRGVERGRSRVSKDLRGGAAGYEE